VHQAEVGSRINPGLQGSGKILFDVPPDATGLVLESLGGYRLRIGDMASLPLGAH
jgi:hypothetical protein